MEQEQIRWYRYNISRNVAILSGFRGSVFFLAGILILYWCCGNLNLSGNSTASSRVRQGLTHMPRCNRRHSRRRRKYESCAHAHASPEIGAPEHCLWSTARDSVCSPWPAISYAAGRVLESMLDTASGRAALGPGVGPRSRARKARYRSLCSIRSRHDGKNGVNTEKESQ